MDAKELTRLKAAMMRLVAHEYYNPEEFAEWARRCPTQALKTGKIQEDQDTLLVLRFAKEQLDAM